MKRDEEHNIQGTPGADDEADAVSGGAPEAPDTSDDDGATAGDPSDG